MIVDETYSPILTAPRDGRVIIIAHPEVGSFLMRWNEETENGLFPGVKGMWETPCGSMTWLDEDGFGPSHWKPCSSDTLN